MNIQAAIDRGTRVRCQILVSFALHWRPGRNAVVGSKLALHLQSHTMAAACLGMEVRVVRFWNREIPVSLWVPYSRIPFVFQQDSTCFSWIAPHLLCLEWRPSLNISPYNEFWHRASHIQVTAWVLFKSRWALLIWLWTISLLVTPAHMTHPPELLPTLSK